MISTKRAGLLLGKILSVVGMLLLLNGVLWRWIYTIRGERYVDSFPSKLFWVGTAIFFASLCVIKATKIDKAK